MTKKEQTSEVIEELYRLTQQFTRALLHRYYYQYQGSPSDLAGDYFVQFMTPKGSRNRPKESLLDKYDASITSLPYLVKVAVTRKLIDSSRQHPYRVSSIESTVNECGDAILLHCDAIANSSNKSDFSEDSRLPKIIKAFNSMPEEERNKHYVELFDSGSSLAGYLKPTIRAIRNCPIQQVTDKSVVLYVPVAHVFVTFDVETGKPRGSFKPFNMTSDELQAVKEMSNYHSKFSRDLLQEYVTQNV